MPIDLVKFGCAIFEGIFCEPNQPVSGHSRAQINSLESLFPTLYTLHPTP
ncbi:MAG: hypothetical protein F6J93_10875 [Oscillatoria sp. SIO1A7]|nr:hypothetical protein [Oscillatoria sp. SIO1A7]